MGWGRGHGKLQLASKQTMIDLSSHLSDDSWKGTLLLQLMCLDSAHLDNLGYHPHLKIFNLNHIFKVPCVV